MGSSWRDGPWGAGAANLVASVTIILVNKQLVAGCNFQFILTTLFLNFTSTALVLESLVRSGRVEAKHIPKRDRWTLAAMGVVTVLLNNASNEANSVGFYQITKLLIIPTVIAFERLGGVWRQYSTRIVFSLCVASLGVAIATVSDFEVNGRGTTLSALSVLATARYQMLQSGKQAEHSVSGVQITHSVAWPTALLGFVAALLVDVGAPWSKTYMLLQGGSLLDYDIANSTAPFWLFVCCLIAVGMNTSTYGLLGKTSPVTYQVLGQLKTCLIVGFGYLFFDARVPTVWVVLRFSGVGVAVVGILSYALAKHSESKGGVPGPGAASGKRD